MKKFVLTAFLVVAAASPSFAQIVGSVGFFADNQGLDCNIAMPQFVPTSVYLVHKGTDGATGSQFDVDWTGGASLIGEAGAPGMLVIGSVASGDLSLAYGSCLTGDFHVYTLTMFSATPVAPCSRFTIGPAPSAGGIIKMTTCAFIELPFVPGQGIINSDLTCVCNVAVEETSWSAIKALYR